MKISVSAITLGLFMSLGMAASFAASGLPGEASPGVSEQPGQSSTDQQQLEKQRREQGIGTSGELNMGDTGMRPSKGPAEPSKSDKVKDEQVMLGTSRPVVRGEVLQIDGDKYTIKDPTGTEVRLMVNQNTRMDCGIGGGSVSTLNPKEQTATDKPLKEKDQGQLGQQGQLQDLSRTQEQPETEVGRARNSGSASSSGQQAACSFKPGDKIEAEVSDMGAATMMKKVSIDKTKGLSEKGTGLGSPMQ